MCICLFVDFSAVFAPSCLSHTLITKRLGHHNCTRWAHAAVFSHPSITPHSVCLQNATSHFHTPRQRPRVNDPQVYVGHKTTSWLYMRLLRNLNWINQTQIVGMRTNQACPDGNPCTCLHLFPVTGWTSKWRAHLCLVRSSAGTEVFRRPTRTARQRSKAALSTWSIRASRLSATRRVRRWSTRPRSKRWPCSKCWPAWAWTSRSSAWTHGATAALPPVRSATAAKAAVVMRQQRLLSGDP